MIINTQSGPVKGNARSPYMKWLQGWKDGDDWQIETTTNDTDAIKAALLRAGCKVTAWN